VKRISEYTPAEFKPIMERIYELSDAMPDDIGYVFINAYLENGDFIDICFFDRFEESMTVHIRRVLEEIARVEIDIRPYNIYQLLIGGTEGTYIPIWTHPDPGVEINYKASIL